jgi:hypothetical protein
MQRPFMLVHQSLSSIIIGGLAVVVNSGYRQPRVLNGRDVSRLSDIVHTISKIVALIS